MKKKFIFLGAVFAFVSVSSFAMYQDDLDLDVEGKTGEEKLNEINVREEKLRCLMDSVLHSLRIEFNRSLILPRVETLSDPKDSRYIKGVSGTKTETEEEKLKRDLHNKKVLEERNNILKGIARERDERLSWINFCRVVQKAENDGNL